MVVFLCIIDFMLARGFFLVIACQWQVTSVALTAYSCFLSLSFFPFLFLLSQALLLGMVRLVFPFFFFFFLFFLLSYSLGLYFLFFLSLLILFSSFFRHGWALFLFSFLFIFFSLFVFSSSFFFMLLGWLGLVGLIRTKVSPFFILFSPPPPPFSQAQLGFLILALIISLSVFEIVCVSKTSILFFIKGMFDIVFLGCVQIESMLKYRCELYFS